MYKIQDFHSPDAPPLESTLSPHLLFQDDDGDPFASLIAVSRGRHAVITSVGGNGSDESLEEESSAVAKPLSSAVDEDESSALTKPFDYDDPQYLVLVVNDERVVIEDFATPNEDGWTPLHACCHSHLTISAGIAIIDAMKAKGLGFEQKTKRGPGTGNAQWTALHMAAAYGVEPLVTALVAAKADCNCTNALTWGPLNEACHRGFLSVAAELVLVGGANVNYLPDAEASRRAPFARPPPQSPLGEAARCGFAEIAKMLLERGAKKDEVNYLGWTPLHEAAFYNHTETVKVLLVFGADATVKNRQGALPFQLASLPDVRSVISDLGGPDALPSPNQPPFVFGSSLNLSRPSTSFADDEDDEDEGNCGRDEDEDQGGGCRDSGVEDTRVSNDQAPAIATPKAKTQPLASGHGSGAKGEGGGGPPSSPNNALLHSGDLLGNLPGLSAHKSPSSPEAKSGDGGGSSPEAKENSSSSPASSTERRLLNEFAGSTISGNLDSDSRIDDAGGHRGKGQRTHRSGGSGGGKGGGGDGRRRAPGRLSAGGANPSARAAAAAEVPEGFPRRLLCGICERPLTDPVRSPYGGVFERKAILTWLSRNGSVCPLTGQPLAESELEPAPDLAEAVKKFFEQQQKGKEQLTEEVRNGASDGPRQVDGAGGGVSGTARRIASEVKETEDDPYDF